MRLVFTDSAVAAIKEQRAYYIQRHGSELADRWHEAVTLAIDSLLTSPERGTLCGLTSPRLIGLRWIPIKKFPYRIFYRLESNDGRLLRVVRVLHDRQDVSVLLRVSMRDAEAE